MPPSEAETRKNFIDRQLDQSGWGVRRRNLLEEFLLSAPKDQSHEPAGSYGSGKQYADYVLLGRDGHPLAIVEAKRACEAS